MTLHNVEQARFNMIEQQVRPWDVADDAVLALLAQVKREDFVPGPYKAMAFADMAIPLPGQQVMLVLEIGSGSGFTTALLAKLAQRVISLEINPELADLARANLQRASIQNAEVRCADGAQGAAAEAPFDVILLGGSISEVPPALLQQLKVGGRLVAIVGNEPIMHATVVTRTSDTNFKSVEKWDDNAPRLQSFPQPSSFKL
jgi:protein-L-isoaspartate(D-aspartate) O-methyltransferase